MKSHTTRNVKPRIGVLLLMIILCGMSNSLSQTAKPQHAKLSLLSEQTSLVPGSSQWLGLRFELDPGWHIYWTNPGDSGEPPKVSWRLPTGIKTGDLQFPAPQRIQDHGLTDYGYEGEVVLLSRLRMPVGSTSNKAEIGADVKYLVCREVCVPARESVGLSLPVDVDEKSSDQV